jgi:hypothetical protein
MGSALNLLAEKGDKYGGGMIRPEQGEVRIIA